MENNYQIGIIKWYNKLKGYGVIITANNEEYFIHISNIKEIPDRILVATSFIFEKGFQNQKKTALNCRIPSTKEDFIVALNLVGQKRNVEIEVEVKYKGHRGNVYTRKEFKDYDILDYFLFKLLRNKPFEIVRDYFITGFNLINQQNDINKIIDYYKITKNRINAITLTEVPKDLIDEPDPSIDTTQLPENTIIDDPLNSLEFLKPIGKIKLLGLESVKSPNPGMESVKSPNPNYLLIKYLINYYNDNSSNFSKFKIWQAGEFFTFSENPNDILQTHYLGETKTKPPFDEYFFIEYRNELSFNDFSRIRRFTLSVATQKIIIENFNKESFRTYDEIKNMIGIISIFSKGTDFFDLIIKRINNDLLFEIWSFKKVYIDYDNKAFSLVFPKNKDFMLPDNILEQKANEININQIRRISIIDINKNETISRILTKKILDKNINSENILDFVESASYLDEVNQRKLLFLFINSNDNINWEILIENKKLNILQNSFGQILAYSFEINEKLADNLSGIISLNSKIQFQNKITLLQNLSNHHLDNFVDKYKDELNDNERLIIAKITKSNYINNLLQIKWEFENSVKTIEFIKISIDNNITLNLEFKNKLESNLNNYFIQDLIKIYKIFPEHYISELIISKIDFNSEYYLREIISIFLLSENQIKLITQNFTSKSAALEISNIINSIQVFNQYNIEIRIEQIDFFSNRNVSLEDIIEIIKLLKVLKDWNYNSLELQINNFLNNYSSDNSDILLQVIKDSSSVIIMESAIKKCNALSNPEEYLDLLLKSELLNEVNKELLKNNLINYISVYPIRILEIALKSLPHYYDLFASQIVLNNQIIIGFYELLQKNELKIKQLTKSKCDLNIVAFFHFNLSEKESIQNINDLFKRYNYDFQSTILKFYFKQYKLNKLSRSQIFSVINSIQCVELSALMLRTFINNRVDNRDELMNLMNQILKSHFKLLSDLNLTDTTFKNIFSIENLVKMCNGRKSYSGTTFWKGGNDVRFYTKGNHFISIGYKEQMLCEGRFWKSQPFYNSVTNKPTEEQYTFYWCKNSACASVNDSIDFNLPFYKWSLLEINELFEINLDRLAFTHLAGWLNRMQSIFDRMKCQECNNLLRPKAFTPHLLGYYAVPLFHCANELCSSFKREVRFTHCRGCSKILDSRECRICQSCNWLICDNDSCGKCGCGANHISVYVQYP